MKHPTSSNELGIHYTKEPTKQTNKDKTKQSQNKPEKKKD